MRSFVFAFCVVAMMAVSCSSGSGGRGDDVSGDSVAGDTGAADSSESPTDTADADQAADDTTLDTGSPTDTASPDVQGDTTPDCPVAVIATTVDNGPPSLEGLVRADLGATIGFDASGSSATTGGTIARVEWALTGAPAGFEGALTSTTATTTTLAATAPGAYHVSLEVWDAQDRKSCETANVTVSVSSGGDLWIELTWNTPGDPNQQDTGLNVGSDLNLHFRHPNAIGQKTYAFPGGGNDLVLIEDLDNDGTPDGWFTTPFDAFWNGWGSWAQFQLQDDADGAGPEQMWVSEFEPTRVYRIGVDYYSDAGFGASTATVRIVDNTSNTQLATATATMVEGDFWQVADFDASTGAVTLLGTTDVPLVTSGVTKAQPNP